MHSAAAAAVALIINSGSWTCHPGCGSSSGYSRIATCRHGEARSNATAFTPVVPTSSARMIGPAGGLPGHVPALPAELLGGFEHRGDDVGIGAQRRVEIGQHPADGVRQRPGGERDDLVRADVDDRCPGTAQMRHPGAEHQSGPGRGPPGRALLPQRRQDPHRQLLRAVGGDLGEQVADARVGEPVEQGGSVGRELVLGLAQVSGRFGPPLHEPAAARVVGDRVGDRVVAADGAGVGEQRVAAVEQPQLAVLERGRCRR